MGGGIDPRIALSGQVPQLEGPIDLAKGGLSVQQLINAVQLQKQQQASNAIRQQQQQIELQQAQQDQKDREAFNKVFHDSGGDWEKSISDAPGAGVSAGFVLKAQQSRAEALAKIATMNKDQLANEQTKLEALGRDAVSLRAISDPSERAATYQSMRNAHLLSGAYKPNELPIDTPNDQMLDSTIAHSKAAQDLIKEGAELREKNAKLPGEQAEALQKRGVAAAQMMNGALNQIAWSARRNLVMKSDPELGAQIPETYSQDAAEQVRQLGISPEKALSVGLDRQAYQQWAADPKNKGKSIQDFQNEQELRKQQTLMPGEIRKIGAEAAARGAAEIAMLNRLQQQSKGAEGKTIAPGMSQDTTDQAATTYHNTGTLPAVGRGQAGVAQRTAIMNREREMFPGTVLSADSQEFKANANSLKKIQGQADSVDAFEKTAGKNLDVFLDQAKKAIDTGLPVLNAPVRMVAGMLGSENKAAFDTSRQTAVAEISRVLNSPTGSGVISDSARHEVNELIRGDANLGQIIQAANILKTDMKNRHDSYNEQIADTNRRLQGTKQPSGASSTPSNVQKALANSGPGKYTLSDGSVWYKQKDGSITQ